MLYNLYLPQDSHNIYYTHLFLKINIDNSSTCMHVSKTSNEFLTSTVCTISKQWLWIWHDGQVVIITRNTNKLRKLQTTSIQLRFGWIIYKINTVTGHHYTKPIDKHAEWNAWGGLDKKQILDNMSNQKKKLYI